MKKDEPELTESQGTFLVFARASWITGLIIFLPCVYVLLGWIISGATGVGLYEDERHLLYIAMAADAFGLLMGLLGLKSKRKRESVTGIVINLLTIYPFACLY